MSAAPFDCTVDAVYALAPETERLTDGATSRMPTPITEATVAGWITDVGAQVGAASYLEAARYPTTSGLNDSSYPGVLWGRSRGGPAGGSAAAGRRHRAGRARGAGRRADARAVLGVP